MRAIGAIPIAEQTARLDGKGEGLNYLLGRPGGRGSLRDIEVKDSATARCQTRKTNSIRNVPVGTVRKSTATSSLTWCWGKVGYGVFAPQLRARTGPMVSRA